MNTCRKIFDMYFPNDDKPPISNMTFLKMVVVFLSFFQTFSYYIINKLLQYDVHHEYRNYTFDCYGHDQLSVVLRSPALPGTKLDIAGIVLSWALAGLFTGLVIN